MPDRSTPAADPLPIEIEGGTGGIAINTTHVTKGAINDVLNTLLDPVDTTAWNLLHQIADPTINTQTARETLERTLLKGSRTRATVDAAQARDLAGRILHATGPFSVPRQEDRRTA